MLTKLSFLMPHARIPKWNAYFGFVFFSVVCVQLFSVHLILWPLIFSQKSTKLITWLMLSEHHWFWLKQKINKQNHYVLIHILRRIKRLKQTNLSVEGCLNVEKWLLRIVTYWEFSFLLLHLDLNKLRFQEISSSWRKKVGIFLSSWNSYKEININCMTFVKFETISVQVRFWVEKHCAIVYVDIKWKFLEL